MRIPSGTTDQYIYFVAVDSTDFTSRETGLSSFTVYRSRDGGAAAAMTTPTINETDTTNMPGVYELLLDEDMTIGSGNDSEEMAFHITHAGMAPVTRTIELYRPKITAGNTLGVAADGDLLEVNTLTGHTAQTGDNYARLGAPAGASVSADIAAIEAQTDDIGAAGAGLTAVPWNASWDAEVQSEVNDGLVAFFTSSAQLVDDIWDEPLTVATHNVANSSGRRLRALQESGAVYGGYIWIDTVNGTAGTSDYENGTSDNPVDSIADANTLAASLGISRFRVAPGSSITFAATQANQEFIGANWTLALGGQNIAGTFVEGATISGTGTGSDYHFHHCHVGTCTLADGDILHSSFSGTVTASAAGDYYFDSCFSGVAGSGTPVFDFGAAVANTNLNVRHYSGGLQIDNKDATGTDQMSLEGNGQLVVSASSGGAISLRGNFKVTNTGGATITYDDNTQNVADILTDTADIQPNYATSAALATVDSNVDAILADTGTDGVVIAAGQTVATVTDVTNEVSADVTKISGSATAADNLEASTLAIITGTAQTGTLSTTQASTDLTGYTADQLIGRVIIFTAGPADGEATEITDYAVTNGVLTFTALTLAPENGNSFVIV